MLNIFSVYALIINLELGPRTSILGGAGAMPEFRLAQRQNICYQDTLLQPSSPCPVV